MARQAELLLGGGKYYEGLRWYGDRWYVSDALRGAVFTVDENGEREDLATFEGLCSETRSAVRRVAVVGEDAQHVDPGGVFRDGERHPLVARERLAERLSLRDVFCGHVHRALRPPAVTRPMMVREKSNE
jgi:hypothetical protein